MRKMMMPSWNNHLTRQSGFTMIEIIIVAVVLGILATIALASFFPTLEKSRDARRKADLANIAKALEAFHADYDRYPLGNNGAILGCEGSGGLSSCNWGETFTDDKGTVYMATLPADPGSTQYRYVSDDGTSYALFARLENENDPSIPVYADTGEPGTYDIICDGWRCNYGIPSPGNTATLAAVAIREEGGAIEPPPPPQE